MEARKFKRMRREYVNHCFLMSLLSALLFIVMSLCYELCGEHSGSLSAMVTSVVCVILTAIMGIVSMLMPDDFEYIIRKINDFILFECDTYDVRCFDKNLRIIFQTKIYLILEDDYSRTKIAYNAAVLKFLKELGA